MRPGNVWLDATVITGGASGIGAAIRRRLITRGLETFDLSRRDNLDVRDASTVEAFYNGIETRLGCAPTHLVACAAIIGATTFPVADIGEWRAVLDTNLTGAFIAAQEHARRLIRERRPGKIVLFGSASGRRPSLENLAYGVAKAGIVALGIGLARGLERHRIRVYTICPSHVDTPLLRARHGATVDDVPLLEPDDVAREVERLLLVDNYVDGQPIYISAMVRAKQE